MMSFHSTQFVMLLAVLFFKLIFADLRDSFVFDIATKWDGIIEFILFLPLFDDCPLPKKEKNSSFPHHFLISAGLSMCVS